jgi:transposase
MTMPTDDHMSRAESGLARRVEIFTGAGRRREWSAAQKAAIVAESYAGATSVCDVARRHGLTPTQLFTWRRIARRKAEAPEAPFAPVVVESREATATALMPESKLETVRPQSPSHVIELDIDGASIWIWREAPISMVTAIIGALKADA